MESSDFNSTRSSSSSVYDIVGIGFGPSNVGLAIAISEYNQKSSESSNNGSAPQLSSLFLEKNSAFSWHPGMLLPRVTMQISFLKDLVTQRNPQSAYSFVNYLFAHNRLNDFINLQTFYPTRLEFNDYMHWIVKKLNANVRYNTPALSITPGRDCLDVTTPTGVVHARNIVVAGGLVPRLPAGITAGKRQFHSQNFLADLAAVPSRPHRRFAVLGAGQSAAEIAYYLHKNYPDVEVYSIFRKYGFTPADDSPFANRIFDPVAIGEFYDSSPEFKEQLNAYHRSTNYSCVDLPLISELYGMEYAERVSGQQRLHICGASQVVETQTTSDAVTLTIEHVPTQSRETIDCDAVVYATGFTESVLPQLIQSWCPTEDPAVSRDYRFIPPESIPGTIYLQGGVEHTHGLTSSLLSNIAIRSGEIVESIIRNSLRSETLSCTGV